LARQFTNRSGRYADEPARALVHRRGTVAMMGTPTRAWRFVGTTHDEVRAGRDLDRVAHACGVDPDVLRHATPIVGEEGQIHLLGHEWHVESTRRQTRRWCPACLAEAPYHRTAWDIDAVTHCVAHRLPLASECPDCAKAVTWYHLDVSRCGCGASLKAIACEAVPEESLAFDAWLARRLDGHAGGAGAIDDMRLRDAIALVERTGAHDLAPHASFADTWKAEGAHTILDRGFRVLRDGPDGFRAFLDRLVAAGRAADHGPRQWGVGVAYGGFGTWLAANAHVESYGEILAIVRRHARANVTLKRGTLLFGEAIGEEAGLNLAEASDRCGIGAIRLSRILRAHGHMPKTRQQGTPVLLDHALVDSIAERLRDCVDANGLAEILGIGAVLASKIVKAGLVIPFVQAGAGRLGAYAIERSQAADLVARLEARLGEPGEHPLVDIATAAPQAYVTVVEAIQWVLAGDLPVRGVDRHAIGLRRVLVTVQDVMATKRRLSGRAMTLNDAAKAIGVKWEAIRQLVSAGHLVAEQRTDGWVIEQADVEAFMGSYVKGADVAARLGTLSKWLPQRLGVEPAIGRDVCRSVFYRVEDVEMALMPAGDRL
jgi:hypothetical protein